jgi:uncharacterized protein YndB with AHSA1/START domain
MIGIDVDHQIKAVTREVAGRTIDVGEAHVVKISQVYDTDPADLWDAVTNIDRIPRWFLPISGDLVVGGSYQLEGQASGTVLTCDPPTNFTATWEYGGNVSWIDVRVDAEGKDRARLVIEHVIAGDDEIWRDFGPGGVGMGWDSIVLGLAIHLATGASVDPEAGQAWAATGDGRRFMRLSSDGWYRAHVAAGGDPEVARMAADRCTSAYLGEEN